jgi:cyclopropane fatty-acyl-phospholipid synthase-like methyltransferase
MSDTVYANPKYRDIDVGAIMRTGHPDIAEGDERIVAAVRKLHADQGRRLRILDVGSGSGDLSLLLAHALPDCEVIANDTAPNPVAQATEKLAPFPHAWVFDQPFEQWWEKADVVISWGSHHHLAHDYLRHVRRILSSGGLFIIGDEFCPEYLSPADKERLATATQITLVDGYIFDDAGDVSAYQATGRLTGWSLGLEQARREALWTWYKFVGDYAVAHDAWPVLIAELGIARDDFITDFDEEHKTSPYLLERELELNGFRIADRIVIGDREPALQSFVIYLCRLAA